MWGGAENYFNFSSGGFCHLQRMVISLVVPGKCWGVVDLGAEELQQVAIYESGLADAA